MLKDYDHPPLPYHEGQVLQLSHHRPPDLFGTHHSVPYSGRCKKRMWNGYLGDVYEDRIEFALEHPPITIEPLEEEDGSRKFVIDRIRNIDRILDDSEDEEGPILLEGKLYGGTQDGRPVLAKVYDGVYYPSYSLTDLDRHNEVEGPGADPMTRADLDYAGNGSLALEYFGSWTFDIPVDEKGNTRPVRMILLEHIEGTQTMAEIIEQASTEWVVDQNKLPMEKDRLEVLKHLILAVDIIWWDA
ncbi:hypothetical protein QBC38DRAFT_521982 [Podospora fimiseda]|uniref:Uncharacterized protein n=1 Tax=Podospora fimiseda TaxID=252190 RepID=A0AAN6YP22_9PEZI|nr:hypothetical protein QBC38DRAFT_521982 [Podospora fimiseda]